MAAGAEASPGNPGVLAARLRIVRGAAIGSVVLACAAYPPWESDNLTVLLLVIVPFGVISGMVLWRLRRAPYRGGLDLAIGSGVVLLFVNILILGIGVPELVSGWKPVVLLVLFGLTQACQVGGALAASRALRSPTGDSTLLARKREEEPGPNDSPVITPQKREEEPAPRDLSVFARPLWRIRGAAIGTLVLLCASVPLRAWADGLVCLLILVLSVPFLVVLWRLRKGPRRDGLCLATGVGTILSAGLGLMLLATWGEWGASREWVLLALALAAQVVMATRALVAHGLLRKSDPNARFLIRGFVDPLVYYGFVALLALGGLSMVAQRYSRPPAKAVAWMRALRECAAAHAASRPDRGFPARLDQLGPQGAKCLEPLSPQGERSGYAFTYSPAAPEPGGRIPGYRVLARPVDQGRLGQKRFFLDQSGVIHATDDDRDATPQDPAEK